jgi:uncharacterized membrane protein
MALALHESGAGGRMTIAAYEARAALAGRSTLPHLSENDEGRSFARTRVNVGNFERAASALLGGALFAFGLRRGGTSSALFGVLGGSLVYRGLSGHCPIYQRLGVDAAHLEQRNSDPATGAPEFDAPEVQRSITIRRPAAELYALWQKPEIQARIMAHFAQVTGGANGNLHWRLRPLAKVLSFETACIEARGGELVRWRSLAGGDLHSEWSVLFRPAPGNYGTELTLQVRFDPPGALWGKALSKLLGIAPRLLIERALRNFKSLVECGEIPSTFHNPSARRGARSDVQPPHALVATH